NRASTRPRLASDSGTHTTTTSTVGSKDASSSTPCTGPSDVLRERLATRTTSTSKPASLRSTAWPTPPYPRTRTRRSASAGRGPTRVALRRRPRPRPRGHGEECRRRRRAGPKAARQGSRRYPTTRRGRDLPPYSGRPDDGVHPLPRRKPTAVSLEPTTASEP